MSMLLEHDYIGLSQTIGSKIATNNGTATGSSLNLKATELRLGLPGRDSPDRDSAPALKITSSSSGAKRGFSDAIDRKWLLSDDGSDHHHSNSKTAGDVVQPESPKPEKSIASKPPASKAQVVGWPPIRASRKNLMAPPPGAKSGGGGGGGDEEAVGPGCLYVKVSMDGAPYLRKIDLKMYGSYMDLSSALEKMFSCFTIGQCGSNGLSKSRLMDLLHGSEFVLTYEDKDGDWMLVGDVPWQMFTESCKRLRIMKSSDAIGLAPRAMEKFKNQN